MIIDIFVSHEKNDEEKMQDITNFFARKKLIFNLKIWLLGKAPNTPQAKMLSIYYFKQRGS